MKYDTKALICSGVTFTAQEDEEKAACRRLIASLKRATEENLKAIENYRQQEVLRQFNDSLARAVEDNLAAIAALKAGFDSSQPRVPRGSSDGGEWTDTGGGRGVTSERIREALRTRTPGSFERIGAVASNSREIPIPEKTFKTGTAVESLHRNLSPKIYGDGLCATNVANALRASGIPLGRPETRWNEGATEPWARDYGQTLKDVQFSEIAKNDSSGKYPPPDYTPQKGDVVVIQPISGQNPAGHIAMYDGKQWVSDFRQNRDIWSNRHYEERGTSYKIYRHPNRR
jgi:hypothetical protein